MSSDELPNSKNNKHIINVRQIIWKKCGKVGQIFFKRNEVTSYMKHRLGENPEKHRVAEKGVNLWGWKEGETHTVTILKVDQGGRAAVL